jgi:asparagine synthase (glutamine-hydrolysing)
MAITQPIARVVDLTDASRNVIYGLSVEEARQILAGGDAEAVSRIEGHFALVAQDGLNVRLARTISRLLRYFVAKREDGPELIVSDRIDAIHAWLVERGLGGQFHPTYTRMVPAHYMVELRLLGCPDPNPRYERFFTPQRGTLSTDRDEIGERYLRAAYDEIARWLRVIPVDAAVGVCFSGGVDSGAVFLLTYHAMLSLGMNPGRLKAFTLSVDGGGADLQQARAFLRQLDLEMFLEPIEVGGDDIDVARAIRVLEDYKPLDVQAGAMGLALLEGIRQRYPEWKYLLDGDGGDENLKDYPIEENPELTIRSVLNNLMLYQEGWGVDSIKHSLTYSGGQSRGYARTYAPSATMGFETLSPFVATSVIAVAEAIPFVALTGWDHERLYELKGDIVARGIQAVTGLAMPAYAKRRFQQGAMGREAFAARFAVTAGDYRKAYHASYA